MTDVVLNTPQKHKGWNKEQRIAAGPKHSPHLVKAGDVVVKMLDNVKPGNQVERAVFIRQMFRLALANFLQASRSTKSECFRRYIDAFGFAELSQHFQVGSSATAHVENARSLGTKFFANVFEKGFDDAPPSGKPPVSPLDLVHDRVSVLLHFLGQHLGDGIAHKNLSGSAGIPACLTRKRNPRRRSIIPINKSRQGCLRSRGLSFSKPTYKFRYSILNLSLRVVSQQSPCFAYVRVCLGNISGLQRLPINDGVLIKFLFKERDQFSQFNRARLAEVEDLKITFRIINRRARARDDVINVCVVASGGAVAKNRDGLSLADQSSEFMYRQIRPLPSAVNS